MQIVSLSRMQYVCRQNARFCNAVRKFSLVGQLPPYGKAFALAK